MTQRAQPLATAIGLVLLAATPLAGQPATDIYVGDLETRNGRLRVVGLMHNITDRDGYDNQPHFLADGMRLFYTSIDTESGQADIYVHDIASGENSRLTRTDESEYSPVVVPAADGFSVVRVERDSTQRLWEFDLNGEPRRVLLPAVAPVGYYAWCDSNTVGLFLVQDPPLLVLARIGEGSIREVVSSVGRSLQPAPQDHALYFVHKPADSEWWIKRLDLRTFEVRPLVRTLPEGEDFARTPEGLLLMARGSKLFSWNPRAGEDWEEVADFSAQNISGISRIAVSPLGNRLAIVANRAAPGGPP